MPRFIHILCIAALNLTGCTMVPRYTRPASPVPDRFVGGSSRSANIAEVRWRSFFSDPRLQQLIEIALQNNRDLRVAILNVEQARAQYRVQRANIIPGGSASGGYTRSRSSLTVPPTTNQFDASIGLTSYELDLFGRVRSDIRSKLESYFAQAETRRATHISLISQIAIQYLSLRENEAQLALARETLASVQTSRSLTQKKIDAGAGVESDLASADVQVDTARVNIHTYERLVAQASNSLAELIGQPIPAGLPAGRSLSDQRLLAKIPAGLSSDLIFNRPDILAAEHTLRSANADIGAARAAFFPTISLTSSIGGSSTELSRLFTTAGHVWSFAPQITVPIFTGGRNKANLDAAHVRKQIEVATYERAIQKGFREVSDSLIARSTYIRQIEAQKSLVSAQKKRFDLAAKKNEGGIGSYLDVLTAQQDYYSAQRNLISTRADQLENLITLYKALGGGWGE